MRGGVVLLASLVLTRCTSTPPSALKHVAFHYQNGRKSAEGDFTTYEGNAYVLAKLPPWKEYLRFGRWQYWYEDGSPRATVTYAVSFHHECCVAGPCSSAYERVVGTPIVNDPQGKPVTLARAPRLACVQTNCAGCAQVFRPRFVLPPDLAPEWNRHDPTAP